MLAADDQIIFLAQLPANLGDGGAHAARDFVVAKIKKRLRSKRTFMQVRACWPDRGFGNRHGMHLGWNFTSGDGRFIFQESVSIVASVIKAKRNPYP
jgi:hypothetical protein